MQGDSTAQVMRQESGMWADDSQRDRIFEMIGCHSVKYHRVRIARVEHQRRVLILVLVAAAVTWAVLSQV